MTSEKLPCSTRIINFGKLMRAIFLKAVLVIFARLLCYRLCAACHNVEQAVVEEVNSWLDDNENCPFSQLRLVKITDITGLKAEVDCIRFLLLISPVLEKMIVKPANSVNGSSKLVINL